MNLPLLNSCQDGPASSYRWTESHRREWVPVQLSWIIGHLLAAMWLISTWQNPFPRIFPFRVGRFDPCLLMKTARSLYNKGAIKHPNNDHAVLLLDAMLLLVSQAVEEFPTSEMHWEFTNKKEQPSWGKCWWEKLVFHSTYKNQSPFFILSISVTSRLLEMQFTYQMVYQCMLYSL